jgi:hypothetical protein
VNSESRYELVSRRALLRGSLALGALVLVPGLASCGGNDDADVLGSGSSDSTAAADTTVAPADTTAATAGTAGADTAVPDTAAAASGASFPAGGELVVNFTYTSTESGGRVHNPYIAVWIEDAAGEMINTISLWMKADEAKYLRELTRFNESESTYVDAGGDIDAVTSATRQAGAYSLVWDGTGIDGAPVAQGDYFICIEAAREHGPYELIREAFTLGAEAFTQALADNGELGAASIELTV